jgi:hypothetical protein
MRNFLGTTGLIHDHFAAPAAITLQLRLGLIHGHFAAHPANKNPLALPVAAGRFLWTSRSRNEVGRKQAQPVLSDRPQASGSARGAGRSDGDQDRHQARRHHEASRLAPAAVPAVRPFPHISARTSKLRPLAGAWATIHKQVAREGRELRCEETGVRVRAIGRTRAARFGCQRGHARHGSSAAPLRPLPPSGQGARRSGQSLRAHGCEDVPP